MLRIIQETQAVIMTVIMGWLGAKRKVIVYLDGPQIK